MDWVWAGFGFGVPPPRGPACAAPSHPQGDPVPLPELTAVQRGSGVDRVGSKGLLGRLLGGFWGQGGGFVTGCGARWA